MSERERGKGEGFAMPAVSVKKMYRSKCNCSIVSSGLV